MRKFPTFQVLSAQSGIMLIDGDFKDIHEIFNFLSPGIMTHEIAGAKGEKVQKEILRQHPRISELDWSDYKKESIKALKIFGHLMTLDA